MNISYIILHALITFIYISIFTTSRYIGRYVFETQVEEKSNEDWKGQYIINLVIMGLFFCGILAAIYAYIFHASAPSEDNQDIPYRDFNINHFFTYFVVVCSIMFHHIYRLYKKWKSGQGSNN